jgi:hypothetical protein
MKSSTTKARWPGWVLILPLLVVGVALSPVIGNRLPGCFFYERTGFLCPGCGATRAAIALQEGRLVDAMQGNVLFAGGVIFGGLWLLLAAMRERFPQVRGLRIFQIRLWFLWPALAGLVVFWVVRNLPCFDFLRPS